MTKYCLGFKDRTVKTVEVYINKNYKGHKLYFI